MSQKKYPQAFNFNKGAETDGLPPPRACIMCGTTAELVKVPVTADGTKFQYQCRSCRSFNLVNNCFMMVVKLLTAHGIILREQLDVLKKLEAKL